MDKEMKALVYLVSGIAGMVLTLVALDYTTSSDTGSIGLTLGVIVVAGVVAGVHLASGE